MFKPLCGLNICLINLARQTVLKINHHMFFNSPLGGSYNQVFFRQFSVWNIWLDLIGEFGVHLMSECAKKTMVNSTLRVSIIEDITQRQEDMKFMCLRVLATETIWHLIITVHYFLFTFQKQIQNNFLVILRSFTQLLLYVDRR